jgi:predicted DNA-binding transcriptional regulator AlpA
MNENEIEIDEICQLIKISHSYFSQKNRKGKWQFPNPIKTSGLTGSKYVYNRKEVMEWYENYALENVLRKKKDNNKIMTAFIRGKFDADATKNKYKLIAIRSKLNKPQTQKIHVKANYDHITWNRSFWGGMI